MKIIILTLPRTINEKGLENIFKTYGCVNNCNIVLDSITNKSKGFGFIEMSEENQAKNAVDKLHGSFLLKNKIRVKMVYKT